MFRNDRFTGRLAAAASAALAAAALVFVLPAAAAENPFPSLVGTWTGSGTAKFDNGKTESLRCKGYYTSQGSANNLGISIRCANASAKVELRANIVDSNGNVSGNWEERTYNQSGSVTGKASSNRLNLAISGGISGSMQVSIGGRSHSVTVATSGPSLKGISISMSR